MRRVGGVGIPKEHRVNSQIRISEIRLVDENGDQLGVVPTREAFELAKERGLDLVEVASTASPPVCRIMDYGKFRYQATRREREARKEHKAKSTNDLREVRLRTRIGEHDRQSKTRLVKRLLGGGSKVKVSVIFRGREITYPEIGMTLLRSVAEDLVGVARMEKTPTMEGRFLNMILSPDPTAVNNKKDAVDKSGNVKEPRGAET